MLACRLEKVFDISSHRRRGNGFPRFFYDKTFPTRLQAHFLGKYVHDDKGNDWSQGGTVLYLVNLKNDELLLKKSSVRIIIEDILKLAILVERSQDGCKFRSNKRNILLGEDLRNTLYGKLVVAVEFQFLHLQLLLLTLHIFQLAFYPCKVVFFDDFRGQANKVVSRSLLLSFRAGTVIDDSR